MGVQAARWRPCRMGQAGMSDIDDVGKCVAKEELVSAADAKLMLSWCCLLATLVDPYFGTLQYEQYEYEWTIYYHCQQRYIGFLYGQLNNQADSLGSIVMMNMMNKQNSCHCAWLELLDLLSFPSPFMLMAGAFLALIAKEGQRQKGGQPTKCFRPAVYCCQSL